MSQRPTIEWLIGRFRPLQATRRWGRCGDPATNFSGWSRRFLLSQYRAADAWPLLGLKEGIEKFNGQPIVGEPNLAPRLVALPVRMPLPPAEYQGSIHENQRANCRCHFVTPQEPA